MKALALVHQCATSPGAIVVAGSVHHYPLRMALCARVRVPPEAFSSPAYIRLVWWRALAIPEIVSAQSFTSSIMS